MRHIRHASLMKVIYLLQKYYQKGSGSFLLIQKELGDEEGGALLARRSNSGLLEEAVCAMGALAGDPERTRTTWSCTMMAWPGVQSHVFLGKKTAEPCARGLRF
jgi:hypothetical protein